jgi:hypothetical protein
MYTPLFTVLHVWKKEMKDDLHMLAYFNLQERLLEQDFRRFSPLKNGIRYPSFYSICLSSREIGFFNSQ